MPDSGLSFESLPEAYQQVVQLAQKQLNIAITPLQELVGGWSGAAIYLVSVSSAGTGQVQHLILKLDRKRPMSRSDEITRHQLAQKVSPPGFASQHIPEIVYERVEADGALAIFYAIAGQSLFNFRTLANFRRQKQLEALFKASNQVLLGEWNAGLSVKQVEHPQALLKRWLGFRLDPGQNIETFLRQDCGLHPDIPGFIVQGEIHPNPLHYARHQEPWGPVRPGDAIIGVQHSDLNTNNILARFSRRGDELEGFYLIDFALFKENMPLLYDQRYLEMSYLVHAMAGSSTPGVVDLITRLGRHDILEGHQVPVEMAGVNAAIRAGRLAYESWLRENHPSLGDDLWGQYWLAGTAAGLSYAHKAGQADEVRLAGLIYAGANLKQFFNLFGLATPVEASQLYEAGQISRQSGTGSPLPVRLPRATHNLPAPSTNFIGRKGELAEISDLLRSPGVRLVTLTGPGGTGKTRLGLESCWALLEHFQDGVYFVDLAPIGDPALVPSTTAQTLGVREGGGRPPLENLKDFLRDKQMLLLFDNFEHLTGAATVLNGLLAAAGGIKALVTSRITLQLRGEHEYPIPPLEIPPPDRQSPAQVLEYESVALFRQQARNVQPHFEITEGNSRTVNEICRRLDGLPLAIEIAAARIKMLPPQALLKRLDQSLKVLVGGAIDLPDRQQTLRQTIDWSYQLLDPAERTVFTRLGIFAGGFTLEAAEAVCNPAGELDVFSAVETLLNSSLLRQVRSISDEPRFNMLQTIREFALEKAAEAGGLAEIHWAHCQYYAQLSEWDFSAPSLFWLKRCEEEHDNFRAALAWAMQHEEGIFPAMAIMSPLIWFWYRYGHLQEGSEWTERAVQITASMDDTPVRALALVGRAYLALWSGDLIVAANRARQAVELSERLSFDQGLAMAELCYGTVLVNQGQDKDAYPHLVGAVELYDQQNQIWMKGASLVHLANVSLGLGDPDQATLWLDMAMPFIEASGDSWAMAFALNNYGEVARAMGDYEAAEDYYRRTEEYFELADAKGDQARLVHTFAYIAQHKGDLIKARALFQESLTEFLELGNHRGIAECLAGLAGLSTERGEFDWAAPLLGAAESQLKAIDGAWWPADRVEIERARERMRSALGDRYEALRAKGQAMGVEQAIAYALAGA